MQNNLGKLRLERPLIIFDLETTGTSITHDRIVEISLIKVLPDCHRETSSRRLNIEMHIAESST
ncbi:MAG: 3'-5' exonuclease, partial [Muribaculaceae bacterium]|nr:3'-5' exonuclease [Muribaculaceae bacterium]